MTRRQNHQIPGRSVRPRLGYRASNTLLARLNETAEDAQPVVQYFAVPELSGVWPARYLQKLACQQVLRPLDVPFTQDVPTHDRDQRLIGQMMCDESSSLTISDYDNRSVQ